MFYIPKGKSFEKVITNLSSPFYAVIDNKLHEFTDCKQVLTIDFDADGNYIAHKNVLIGYKNTNDTEGIELNPLFLFNSMRDFECGNYASAIPANIYSAMIWNSKISYTYCSEDMVEVKSFVYDKDKMMAEPFKATSIRIELLKCSTSVFADGVDVKNLDIYASEVLVYNDNSYRKVDADGVEHIVAPEYFKIRPTDVQRELLSQIDALIQNARKAGIRFLFDNEDSTLLAFNDDGIMDWGYEPNTDFDNGDEAIEHGQLIPREKISSKHCYIIKGDFSYLGYDDSISIKSDDYIKKEQQKAK